MRISAVVNTTDLDEKHIVDCLETLGFVDEIVIVDMESRNIKHLGLPYTKNIFNHKKLDFVEPARNFGLKKATGDWILIVDPDERVSKTLAATLIDIAEKSQFNFVRLPRQNIIFNHWMRHSRWWPDYNIRFFQRGAVEWQDEIHSIPITQGAGLTLEAKEDNAIIHYNYQSLADYFERLNRYSNIQRDQLLNDGYQFSWPDLLTKPSNEFLSRFFAGEGYKDGLHGFALALLQAFTEMVVFLKVWEKQGFTPKSNHNFVNQVMALFHKKAREFKYWFLTVQISQTQKLFARFFLRLKRKFAS